MRRWTFATSRRLKSRRTIFYSYIGRTRYVSFGIEPLVAYLIARENEVKLVRIVLTGKKIGLPPEEIKERLREMYV